MCALHLRPRRDPAAAKAASLCAGLQWTGGGAGDLGAVGHIADDDRAGGDGAAAADREVWQDASAQADEGVRANADAAAEDRPGGDVRVLADVALVLDDRAGVDDGVLADAGEGVHDGARGDEGARTDTGGGRDVGGGVGDRAGGLNRGRGPQAFDQIAAVGEVAQGDVPERRTGPGQGRQIGERPGVGDARVAAAQDCRGIVVEEAGDDVSLGEGGLGDDEGVAAAAQEDQVRGGGERSGGGFR